MERVVLKLSSGLLVRDGTIQYEWLDSLGEVIAGLRKDNYKIWLVTSGASALKETSGLTGNGQDELFSLYAAAFSRSGLAVAEVLLNKDQFERRADYLEIRERLEELASQRVIGLINEQGGVFTRTFSDNDEIAGLVASLMDAKRLVLASTVAGVLDGTGNCLSEIAFGNKEWTKFVTSDTSLTGRGGMLLKCRAAEHSAQRGVETTICDGTNARNIQAAMTGRSVGTKFVADRRISAKKRWIFDKKEFSKGVIQVDAGLAAALQSDRAVSVLSVGVASIDGDFAQNEIVAVRAAGATLGYGQVRLDSKTMRKMMACGDSALVIHCDQYMGVFS
jgi:glutamate 5-kinase